jgi:hypothetical protein
MTLFGPITRLLDSEIHCVNLFHINDHVFANVAFECHDELRVLSNLLLLPSVIRGGMLAYCTVRYPWWHAGIFYRPLSVVA